MNRGILLCLKFLPIITLTFSLVIFFIVLVLLTKPMSYVIFSFLTFEMYANWLAVFIARDSQNVAFDSLDDVTNLNEIGSLQYRNIPKVNIKRIWYCPKCHTNTSLNCHHCILCNKCIIQQDHHCFFLGVCICLRNLCYFITFCLYTGIISLYVNINLFQHLHLHFQDQEVGNPSLGDLGAHYFFPAALGKWISGQEQFLYLILVALFDVLILVGTFTFGFGVYNLYISITGEAAARLSGITTRHRTQCIRSNFHKVYGRWGMLNFIFPNALVKHICHRKCSYLDFKYV